MKVTHIIVLNLGLVWCLRSNPLFISSSIGTWLQKWTGHFLLEWELSEGTGKSTKMGIDFSINMQELKVILKCQSCEISVFMAYLEWYFLWKKKHLIYCKYTPAGTRWPQIL